MYSNLDKNQAVTDDSNCSKNTQTYNFRSSIDGGAHRFPQYSIYSLQKSQYMHHHQLKRMGALSQKTLSKNTGLSDLIREHIPDLSLVGPLHSQARRQSPIDSSKECAQDIGS